MVIHGTACIRISLGLVASLTESQRDAFEAGREDFEENEGVGDGLGREPVPTSSRTAPLWGLGQRLFFLHDGRCSDTRAARRRRSSWNTKRFNLELGVPRMSACNVRAMSLPGERQRGHESS
jgi:hypothetical protein